MVWMRTAGMPNFRKLWGKIEFDLVSGLTYTLEVTSNYDVSSFKGAKYIVLSTTNAFGGKNEFLAYCYLTVGSFCIIFAILFFVAHWKKKNGGSSRVRNE